MKKRPTALALFSGGLDSILAARLLQAQEVNVICLHFTSPFFGNAKKIPHWQREYGLNIIPHDISMPFVTMLANGPAHGFGKAINPCIDCKILLLTHARQMMAQYGADFLATGEVTGQRPMSQRKDTMNLIARDAGVKDVLLRPLCARYQTPLPVEEQGLVDHSLFPGISGRGRGEQLALAEKFGLTEIPTPAGGCLLTEKENTRRYWKILKTWRQNSGGNFQDKDIASLREDLELAGMGRQVWHGDNWLCLGRNQRDNEKLALCARGQDVLMRLAGFPGPHALARNGMAWGDSVLASAGALLASYSPKAVAAGASVYCELRSGQRCWRVEVWPDRQEGKWITPTWEETRDELRLGRR